MTFTEIKAEVAERCNITSTEGLARVGRSINEKYRWLLASVGMQTSSQTTKTANTVVGNQQLTFALAKVQRVYDNSDADNPIFLAEGTVEEIRGATISGGDPARAYAPFLMGATTTTILLDSIPASIYTLTADGIDQVTALSGTLTPAFPEHFHQVLVYGASEVEFRKKEKFEMADQMEAQFTKLRNELAYFISKSAMLSMYQGKQRVRRRGGRLL